MSADSLTWIALAGIAALAAVVQTARLWWHRVARASALRARVERAAVGEVRGERLLVRHGYAVLGRQVRGSWSMRADGEAFDVDVRADLVVAKDGRRYVAEVKTGKLAPSPVHIATRRQLLEYRVAFDVDGVLLVDAESERVMHVDVVADERGVSSDGRSVSWIGFAVGVIVGVVLGIAIVK